MSRGRAESLVLEAIGRRLEATVEPARVDFPGGSYANVDDVSQDPLVFVEVFSRQRALKGGQRHKVADDILKLIYAWKGVSLNPACLAFADETAARSVRNKSWLAEAVTTWGVEVVVVDLPEGILQGLRDAQAPGDGQSSQEQRPGLVSGISAPMSPVA